MTNLLKFLFSTLTSTQAIAAYRTIAAILIAAAALTLRAIANLTILIASLLVVLEAKVEPQEFPAIQAAEALEAEALKRDETDPWATPELSCSLPQPAKNAANSPSIPLLLPPARVMKRNRAAVASNSTQEVTCRIVTSPTQQELTALKVKDLRLLCCDRGIQWRNAHGRNRHLTKAQMIMTLKA